MQLVRPERGHAWRAEVASDANVGLQAIQEAAGEPRTLPKGHDLFRISALGHCVETVAEFQQAFIHIRGIDLPKSLVRAKQEIDLFLHGNDRDRARRGVCWPHFDGRPRMRLD